MRFILSETRPKVVTVLGVHQYYQPLESMFIMVPYGLELVSGDAMELVSGERSVI